MNKFIFENIQPIDLDKTFNCGQCFRWLKQENQHYIGVVNKYIIDVHLKHNKVYVSTNANQEFVHNYFDLARDYSSINTQLSNLDDIMKKVISYGAGIRILRQPKLETIVSFLFSSNNNIPRIKKIIERLCQHCGDVIIYGDKEYFLFPTLNQLVKITNFDFLKSGYRIHYLADLIQFLADNDLEIMHALDTMTLKSRLMSIRGIGNKISDCILLFAYSRFDTFPVDVWIKRAMYQFYGIEENKILDFASENFEKNQGLAQQYLYYYAVNQDRTLTF